VPGGLPAILFKTAKWGRAGKNQHPRKARESSDRFSGRDSSFLEPRRSVTADLSDHRQQAAGCFVLRNEGIDHLQCVFWDLIVAGNHNDWKLRPDALYFGRKLMSIHLGHVVVDDHGGNAAGYGNLQTVSSGGNSEYRISTPFEQRSMKTQHAVIIVDTQNYSGCCMIGHNLVSPQNDDRRYALTEADQICTLFATTVAQVDLW
jgi:hypothetical protein